MFRRIIVIGSLVVALAGTAALAQGLHGKAAGRVGFRAQQFKKLQQRLNLTEDQVGSVRALAETRRSEMESLRQQSKQKRQGLRALLQQSNPNPSDVGNATLALKDTREKAREINQRFLSGVKALLTPEQLSKLPKRFQ